MIWWALIAAAAMILAIYARHGANAVWGTATAGALIGLVATFLYPGEFWWTLGKAAAIGTFVGLAFELMPKLGKRSSE